MVVTIIVFALTFLNWFIYHKIFTVYYVGGVGKGLLKEIVGSFIVAILEMALFYQLGVYVIQIVIIIAFVIGIILVIKEIYQFIVKGKQQFVKKEENNIKQGENNFSQNTHASSTHDDSDIVTDELLQSYANVLMHIVEGYALKNPECDERQIFFHFFEKFLNERKRDNTNISIKIICKKCGKEISRDAKFCNFCGEKI